MGHIDSEESNATIDLMTPGNASELGIPNGNNIKVKEDSRAANIPYILNGELYVIQTQEGENVTVKCCNCPPERVYRGSVRSTGNFHMHIKRRHPDLLGKLHEMKVNALVERRDRLMRNRKFTQRGVNSNCNNNTSTKNSNVKEELEFDQPQTNIIHTHKLKIKSAYQRHQLEQKETMRNWVGVPPLVVVPIANTSEINEAVNYSLKRNNTLMNNSNVAGGMNSDINDVEKEQQNSVAHRSEVSEQQDPCENSDQSTSQQTTQHYENSNDDSPDDEHVVAMVSLSQGTVSNICCGSNFSETNSIAIVKNEILLPEHAIDLSMQNANSSGIGLSSSGISSNVSVNPTNSNSSPNFKWSDLLMQVETSLQDIQREMRTRNQIETNRILLDIAKFKFLHPGFNFNY